MERNRILVVDDDPLIRGSLYEMLRGRRYDVEMASDGSEAMEHLRRRPFQLVLTDWKMPQVDGIHLLSHIKRQYPDISVVLITGFGNISSAVEAIREGAFDYLTKPIHPEELEQTVTRALSQVSPPLDAIDDPFAGVIGRDPSMQKLFSVIRSVANSPATVLLEGESGTGKRVIAQAIHRADPKRRHHPFVEISCGALPETLLESELFGHVKGSFTGAIRDKQGRFEVADGGTILLDEIDAFSPALQVKLLRVIQERLYERVGDTRTVRVDVRIIAATNRTLSELVKQGKFREDLYYRLNVIALRLPPLRERKLDLSLFIQHCIERGARSLGKTITGVSPDALHLLMRYSWPGNIRELENVMERAVTLAKHERLDVEDFPDEICVPTDTSTQDAPEPTHESAPSASAREGLTALKDALRMPERDIILQVLAEVRWNRSEAAKRLGIHRSTLYHKIRQLGIHTSSS
ncbi:MAG: sigma-54-dependent Fis family transcriptional regulator [Candidatus Omnitrophica bacterium]|nr:sigma-54-dependent Fis family transcriptional regulator [Candidatus Omnitrophota bacterium]